LEGDEGEEDESDNEGRSKTCSTPLWKYATKLEGAEGWEPLNLYVAMVVIRENLTLVHIFV
jgi:hypothetical protein